MPQLIELEQISSFAHFEENEEKVVELVTELLEYLSEPYADIVSIIFNKEKFRPQWAILLSAVMRHADFHDWGRIEIYEKTR